MRAESVPSHKLTDSKHEGERKKKVSQTLNIVFVRLLGANLALGHLYQRYIRIDMSITRKMKSRVLVQLYRSLLPIARR